VPLKMWYQRLGKNFLYVKSYVEDCLKNQ